MRSKTKTFLFVLLTALGLGAVPVTNLALGASLHLGALFSFDFLRPWSSVALYSLGISLNPGQVIVGKNGWLYLGDDYNSSVTNRRRGISNKEIALGSNMGAAMSGWNDWMHNHGVRTFRVMVFPDKETIYPEFLPDWAKPASPSATNALLADVDPSILIDTRPNLKQAKAEVTWPLYHRHDTHWNTFGAWVAFQDLTAHLDGISRLPDSAFRPGPPTPWQGGDLSRLLFIRPLLFGDVDLHIDYDLKPKIVPVQIDYDSGWPNLTVGNPEIGAPQRPLLVVSKNALNKLRVLWFRDSFGSAMSPFMASTFSDVLQLHSDLASPDEIKTLVEKFKPNIVILSAVERGLRNPEFQTRVPD